MHWTVVTTPYCLLLQVSVGYSQFIRYDHLLSFFLVFFLEMLTQEDDNRIPRDIQDTSEVEKYSHVCFVCE